MAVQHEQMKVTILKALEHLMLSKTYSDISINDICTESFISKPTFYRYFSNKDDIFRWISEYALRTGLAQVGRKYGWLEANYRTACVHLEHKTLFTDAQSPTLIAYLIDVGFEYLKTQLQETIVEYKKIAFTEKLEFQIDCYLKSAGLMSRKWAEDHMNISAKTIAEYMTSVVPYDLYKLLNIG